MFILSFIVMFGPKKGTLAAYSSVWDHNFITNMRSATLYSTLGNFRRNLLVSSLGIRFHFTSVTSRLTSYFLFAFWLFFFFYGESLLLIILNYTTLVDSISSSSFITLKQHIIFYILTTPAKLTTYINFYIYFLTSCSFMFLINFNYLYNYNYFKHNTLTSVLIISIVLFYNLVGFIL